MERTPPPPSLSIYIYIDSFGPGIKLDSGVELICCFAEVDKPLVTTFGELVCTPNVSYIANTPAYPGEYQPERENFLEICM